MITFSLLLGWGIGLITGFFIGGLITLKQFEKDLRKYTESTNNLIDFYRLLLDESIIKYNKLAERLDRGYETEGE